MFANLGTRIRETFFEIGQNLRSYLPDLVLGFLTLLCVAAVLTITIFGESKLLSMEIGIFAVFIQALENSKILTVLESISIITGVILFLFFGLRAQKASARYEAWKVLDLATQETSYARNQALKDLNDCGTSLKGFDATGIDLNRVELDGIDFSEATLEKTSFRYAKLRHSSFVKAKLNDCDFRFSYLKRANFYNVEATGAKFSRVRARRACFRYAILNNSDLSSADLYGADFRNSDLTGCKFKDANISYADFRGSTLPNLESMKHSQGWQLASYDNAVRTKLLNPRVNS